MTDKCDHGQLYVHIKVTVAIPIEHNSAIEVSRAMDLLHSVLDADQLANHKFGSSMDMKNSSDI